VVEGIAAPAAAPAALSNDQSDALESLLSALETPPDFAAEVEAEPAQKRVVH
jgi:hypothetical protein